MDYSVFYLNVCLFDLLNLLFIIDGIYLICFGLFPKPPLYAPSFVFTVWNHRVMFLTNCFLKVLPAF